MTQKKILEKQKKLYSYWHKRKSSIGYIIHQANGIPLGAEANFNVFKLLFLDIGLVNRLLGLSWSKIMNMTNRVLIHEGSLAEQFVGQSLLHLFSRNGMQEPQGYYWLRENKALNAEVDFVVSVENKVIPIEVKSGKAGSLKSLLQFAAEKKTPMQSGLT